MLTMSASRSGSSPEITFGSETSVNAMSIAFAIEGVIDKKDVLEALLQSCRISCMDHEIYFPFNLKISF